MRSASRRNPLAWLGAAATTLIYLFLLAPTLVVVATSFTGGERLAFPPDGLSLRWYEEVFTGTQWWDATRESLIVMAIATPICLLLATPAAYGLVRGRFPGRGALNLLILSPLMLPQVMLGLAMLYFFARRGLLDTTLGVVVGHVVVVMPYVVRTIGVSMYSLDPALERAAAVLGAGRWRTFKDVTLPLIRPGLMGGVVFGAVLSLGELAVTLFVAGPSTTTLPLLIFSEVQFALDPTIAAVSSLFLGVALIVFWVLDRLVGLARVL